jgi:peptidoglycan hydrolase CwlO-like protein
VSVPIPFVGRRDRRKHSPDTVIRNLRDENVKLLNRQAAADDFFAVLMTDVATTNAAWEQEKQLRGEAEEAAAQMRMERDEWRDRALELQARFGPQLAAEANAARITVPPMVRDTGAVEDQATAPIDVRPLWDALGVRPVTDPGRIH